VGTRGRLQIQFRASKVRLHVFMVRLQSAADSFHSLGKTALFNIKEAHNHSFSSKVYFLVNFSIHAQLAHTDSQLGMVRASRYSRDMLAYLWAGLNLRDEIMYTIIQMPSRNRTLSSSSALSHHPRQSPHNHHQRQLSLYRKISWNA
jgi:hypothetical protein